MKLRTLTSALLAAAVFLAPRVSDARWLNPNTGRFQTMDSFEGSQPDPLSLHKYLYAHCDPINRVDPSGNTDLIETISTTGIQVTLQTANAVRAAPALAAARVVPFITGGTAFIANYGPRALQYLRGFGPRGVAVLQTAFQRSTEIVTRSQALQSPNWSSSSAMREALNRLVNNGSTANPANIQWHHLIEVTRGAQTFGANAVNSMVNIVPTPTHVHSAITRLSASGQSWLPGFSRMRDYVSAQTWERQYEIGLRIWQHAMETEGQVLNAVIQKIVLGN
jgi:hypothetical protein